MSLLWTALILSGIAAIHEHIGMAAAEFDPIGVVLGTTGNDIPDAQSIVELCHKYGFKKIRISADNSKLMYALMNQNIAVTLDIENSKLPSMVADGKDDQPTLAWIRSNVKPFISKIPIEYIVVGNEAIPGPFSQYVAPAIRNIKNKLLEEDIEIKVTTAVSTSVLKATFPPSSGEFKAETRQHMSDVLLTVGNIFFKPVLMVNVYPYYYHAAGIINQDFATFSTQKPVYWDGLNDYWNMLDALLDAFYNAMSREDFYHELRNLSLVVGATGWPSGGNGKFTTPALAATYNQNLMRRLARGTGTPAKPGYPITGFVYALFDENLKPAGPSRHFGLFSTNKTAAYRFLVPRSSRA